MNRTTMAEVAELEQASYSLQDEAFKNFIRTLSHVERDRLGALAGVSGSYITSLVYRKSGTCSLAIAVAIDKVSKGKLDFRTMLQRHESVDWDYVTKKLCSH